MPFSKEKLSATCQKTLPFLLTAFLLSYAWAKHRSWPATAFYAALATGCFTLDKRALRPLLTFWPALLFTGWFTLSTLWSPSVTAEGVGESLQYSLSMLALLLLFTRPARNQIFWKWLPVAATPAVLFVALTFYSAHPLHIRLTHFGTHPNRSGWLYAFFALTAIINLVSPSAKQRWGAILNGGSLLIFLFALALTQSRGAALGFGIGCAALAMEYAGARWLPRVLCVTGLLACLMAAPPVLAKTAPASLGEAAEHFVSRGSTYRTEIYQSALAQMPGHWWIGHGLKAPYPWLKTQYLDYGIPFPVDHLHSLPVWALFHGGIIGLACLILLLAHTGWRAIRSFLQTQDVRALPLLAFGISCALVDGRLFICGPRIEWIVFWIPVCYALTAGSAPKTNPTNPTL